MGRRGRDWGAGGRQSGEGGRGKGKVEESCSWNPLLKEKKKKRKKSFVFLKQRLMSLYFKTKNKVFEPNFPCFA